MTQPIATPRSVGRYTITKLLKAGGGGEVWLGEHPTLGAPIVVKLILPELANQQDARGRFEREARIAARMRSANVVQIIDYGVTDAGEQFIVMERLEGETLRERLTARGTLSPKETAAILAQVCKAVTRAHEERLVHRDLKPDNIFLAHDPGGELVKVLDFGVTKVTDGLAAGGVDPTASGALLGTPSYMSPEQAQGLKSVDFRSDLWSLGVIAVECITGKRPFVATSIGPLIKQIVVDPIRLPSILAPDRDIAPALDAWAARALQRDPTARFESAEQLAEELARIAGSMPDVVGQKRALVEQPGPGGDLATAREQARATASLRPMVLAVVACAVIAALVALRWFLGG